MKKYVIITPTISNMGGAQMYVCNKAKYYQDKGWNSCIIAGDNSDVLISGLKEYNKSYYELNFPIYYFSSKTRNRIIESVIRDIIDIQYEEIVVESTSISNATWAELIARKIGAKHIVYLLQECNEIDNMSLLEYMKFKFHRRELVGIKSNTLKEMFRPYFSVITENAYHLPAHCNNVVEDVDSDFIRLIERSNYDYIIGILSRLDKPYYFSCISDVCTYVSLYPNKRFILLLMGDAPKGSPIPQEIKKIMANYQNVKVVLCGYLYPLPSRLLELCDVCLSSAGSAHVCHYSGVPTISYDAHDYQPIGIIGKTTKNGLFRDESEAIPIFTELMNKILMQKVYKKEPPCYERAKPDFQEHESFLINSNSNKDYYDIDSLHKETRTDKMVSFVLSLVGADIYKAVRGYKISKWLKHKIC